MNAHRRRFQRIDRGQRLHGIWVIEIPLPSLAERKRVQPVVRRVMGLVDSITSKRWRCCGRELAGEHSRASRCASRFGQTAGDDKIDVAHLPLYLRRRRRMLASRLRPRSRNGRKWMRFGTGQRRMIEVALRKSRGDQTAAADLLGIYRSRLNRRIKALGLGE
jgi:transcriptional regulator of acetoin/glycerol metabolism